MSLNVEQNWNEIFDQKNFSLSIKVAKNYHKTQMIQEESGRKSRAANTNKTKTQYVYLHSHRWNEQ